MLVSVLLCFTAKLADAVSLTSCDSNDSSSQSSTVPTHPAVLPSSSSSTLSEDCVSDSVQCKSPPTPVDIDLELLRKEEAILEFVSCPVEQSPVKLLSDSDAESSADVANDITDNVAESAENCTTAAHNGDKMPEIVDETTLVFDDDFESIYSRQLMTAGDRSSVEMSLDDAIINSLMASRDEEFRDVVQPGIFREFPATEDGNENHLNDESSVDEVSVPRQITVPQITQQNSDDSISHAVSGTRQSVVVNNWLQLPAPANIRSLSVSSRHVWCVDMSGQLLYSQLSGPGLRWFVVTTAPAQQVSVSPSGSLVWRLDGNLVYAARNVTARQPWGNKWAAVARGVTWISVDNHVAW